MKSISTLYYPTVFTLDKDEEGDFQSFINKIKNKCILLLTFIVNKVTQSKSIFLNLLHGKTK